MQLLDENAYIHSLQFNTQNDHEQNKVDNRTKKHTS